MKNIRTQNKILASYAVFRDFNEKGKNINEILSEFIIGVIKSEKLFQFDLSEIHSLLNSTYEFNIPEAVIKTSLNKIDFISFQQSKYTVQDNSKLDDNNIKDQEEIREKENIQLLEKLFSFIEEEKKSQLNETDKTYIVNALYDFLLDNSIDNSLSNYISTFILDIQKDNNLSSILERIKEGVLLSTALRFNPDFNENQWKTQLTIYLNMEILFHFNKLNGELYFKLFQDFYNLVKEINKSKVYIRLKYFKSTKIEIDNFFLTAESIVAGKAKLDFTNDAMVNIVNGCQYKADVLVKKSRFYSFLETNGILLDNDEYEFNEDDYKYNILSQDIYEELFKNITPNELDKYLLHLNNISILRQGRVNNNFENIGFILLTENRKINKIAWDSNIKEEGQVPLTTNLQFVTNKLWFKLNKGFGKDDYPSTFKVITKAQIILASHISETLHKQYLELQKELLLGEFSENDILSAICEIKERLKFPEQLLDEDSSTILDIINNESIDKYILEHSHMKQEIVEKRNRNNELEKSLESSIEEKNILKTEADNYKQELFQHKEKEFNTLENQKILLDKLSAKIFTREKYLGIASYVFILLFFLDSIDWNIFEKWTWGLTLLSPVVLYLFKNKFQKINEFILNRQEVITSNVYAKNHFSLEKHTLALAKLNELKD